MKPNLTEEQKFEITISVSGRIFGNPQKQQGYTLCDFDEIQNYDSRLDLRFKTFRFIKCQRTIAVFLKTLFS